MSHSGQKFSFDIPLLLTIAADINEGLSSKDKLAVKNGLGDNKIESFIDYLKKVDMVIGTYQNLECTYFARNLLNMNNNYGYIEPLLLYKLSRPEEDGGHLYFSYLIRFLYDIAFKIDNKITCQELVDQFNCEAENMVKNKEDLLKQALSMGLADATTGFGKMGMVVNNNDNYEISGYIPHNLITAYILYDNWPAGRTALKISEVISNDYLPGKIFFLGRDIINQQLHELALEKIIFVEQEAGLDQIRLNPQLTANDILDRMVNLAN